MVPLGRGTVTSARMPVLLLDSIGYSFYRDAAGRPFLPADRYAVRLVTDLRMLDQARGAELESVVGVPKYDERAVADAVRFQATRHPGAAERLITVTERLLLPAAALREELGIPGPTVAQVALFRDKIAMKEHLRSRGIAVPAFAPFSVAAATDLLRTCRKLIAKPRLGLGAADVHVLDGPAAVAAFAREQAGRLDDFEVEQFIDGQLCHVDSIVQDGVVLAAVGSKYLDDTRSFLTGAPCRDVGLAPGPELDRLLEFNERVLACYPGFTGATHHEMFLTDGGAVFCEIAARAGGGGVIAGFRSRTGVNLDEAVLRAQLDGTVPVPEAVPAHLTGWVVIYAAGSGVLAEPITVPEQPWVLESQILAEAGQPLSAPANCNAAVAIVCVRGDTEDEVTGRLAEVIERAVPRVRPASADPAGQQEGSN